MKDLKVKLTVVVGALLMLASLFLIFVFAPTDVETGDVQRIFYIHVPLAWVSLLSFTAVFAASVLYLVKGENRYDLLAAASAEVGIIFTTLFLITGSLWARAVWGSFWTWDARLTSSLILWFIYLGYLITRSLATGGERRARLSAVVGVIGFIDIPVVVLSIVLWRTQHPEPLVFQGGLSGDMTMALVVSIIAFTSLYLLLYRICYRLKWEQKRLDEFKQSYQEME